VRFYHVINLDVAKIEFFIIRPKSPIILYLRTYSPKTSVFKFGILSLIDALHNFRVIFLESVKTLCKLGMFFNVLLYFPNSFRRYNTPKIYPRSARAETRNRAKDELKRVINAVERVRKWSE
jgi:hypothetical protein